MADICGFDNRIYVVTDRNKLLSTALSTLTGAQLCFGLFSIAWAAVHPCKFPNTLLVLARIQFASSAIDTRDQLGRVQSLLVRTVAVRGAPFR